MSVKRIRCDCGRIYDPANHANCPDCGAPTPLIAQPAPEPADEQELTKKVPAPSPVPAPTSGSSARKIVIGLVLLLALGELFLLVRPKTGRTGAKIEQSPTPSATVTASPASSAAPTAPESTTPIILPPQTQTPPPYAFFPPPPFDLAAAIANAAPGATINVPAGFYRGGFVVRQSLHLAGQSNMGGMVMIQSEGREAFSIEAKDVSIANMQISSQGIGQLPAISVAKDAQLKLDGCTLQAGSEIGVIVGPEAKLETVGTSFTAARGTAVRLEAGAKGKFTQSSFSNSVVGLSLTAGTITELRGCAFENDGLNNDNGAAISLEGMKAQLSGDDCHFASNSGAINVFNHASIALQNSAFKSNGGSAQGVVGLVVIGQGANARLTNSTFEQNRAGVLIEDGGQLEMQKCTFDQNGVAQPRGVVAGSLPLSIAGRGSRAVVRQSVLSRSAPYAASVIAGGELVLEDSEVSGSSEIGLLVGERSAPGGHAEIKNSHFLGNSVGLGVCANAFATAQWSEFRGNNDGIVVLDPKTELRLTQCKLRANRNQGLHVFSGGSAGMIDCDLRENQIGALSGTRGRSNQRGTVLLENCRFGGNRTFAAGAARESTLTLKDCAFDGTDKLDIFKERGAIVQENAGPTPEPQPSFSPGEEEAPSPAPSERPGQSPSPGTSPGESPSASPMPGSTISPSPSESPSPTPQHKPRSHSKPTPKPHPHPPTPEEIRRTLRKLLPGG